MRKLKKFVIASNIHRLTDIEQIELLGGQSKTTGCEEKTYSQCSGVCYIDSYEGTCGWTYANYNRCTCAVVTVG